MIGQPIRLRKLGGNTSTRIDRADGPPKQGPAPSQRAVAAPGAAGGAATPAAAKPANFLHAAHTAGRDVMRVCNQIKRLSSLVVTASASGRNVDAILAQAEELTDAVLDGLGFDSGNPTRQDAVRPMVMEAVCCLMSDMARAGQDPLGSADAIRSALLATAKSRGMARAIDRDWPAGVDESTAVRVAAVNALTPVQLEAQSFDFFHEPEHLMKEAAAALYEVVHSAVEKAAPGAATHASRMVLTQSFLQSGGKIMAAVWAAHAEEMIRGLNALPSSQRTGRVAEITAMSVKDVIRPIRDEFDQSFTQMVEASDLLVERIAAPERPGASVAEPQAERTNAPQSGSRRIHLGGSGAGRG